MRVLIIISAILFINVFSGVTVKAGEIELQHNVPDRYIVIQGDTLWSIASRFLKDPWRWPEIWNQNRKQVKNPYTIYPGDIIVLEKTAEGSQLKLSNEKAAIKLSPKMRIEKLGVHGIPNIPVNKIKPFLSQPLVIEKHALDKAPLILGTSDNRVILSTGDTIYIRDLPADQGASWQVFRAGKALMDPDDNNRILGYEAIYLGDVEAKNYAPISTVKVTHSVQEILNGDRLIRSPADTLADYVPHAPNFAVEGRIISVYGGVTEIGENAIITLNKGVHDGLEEGHVLAIYRKSKVKSPIGKIVALPDERIGLVLVFRVFDKVSYALVTQSAQAIKVLDAVRTPD
ncbi:LysM domain-containing protein [Nitrosomonas sp. Nm132]|nr:LysM domain-containing protein [Nitrosomonas sp. Nm132]